MNILIINAGSSSLKYQLINMNDESTVAKGNVERIGIEGSNLVLPWTRSAQSVTAWFTAAKSLPAAT